MKIAIYTIALNEEQFVERWYNSAKDADQLLILDTGSTDKTIKLAKKLGIDVFSASIKPWRFDDARNAALSLVKDDIDICIALDMDEVLVDGWRQELEKINPQTTRPRYEYTWSWNKNNSPALQYGGDKIHSRHGYRWKHPVHEVAVADRIEEKQEWTNLKIHHYPDATKSRGQYFSLLELSTKENPYDDRNAFYLGREYFFYARFEEAAKELKRHLSLPTAKWAPERAASMRYIAKCEPENAKMWLEKAVLESPGRRESLVELAQHFYSIGDFKNCYLRSAEALSIKEKPLDYLCEDFAWKDLPHDLAAISAWHLNDVDNAIIHIEDAIKLNPENLRLKTNLEFFKEKLNATKEGDNK
jgi:glycosyltransferase involved in cell wall biosynthesis